MQADVILTNPSGTTGESVARSLQEQGLRVAVMEAPNARKMEDSYIARLHKFVDEYNPETVWPVFFCDVLARHRDEFPTLSLPLDDPDKILQLDDKSRCCALAEKLGIRQPRMFTSIREILSERGGDGAFPVVFKRPMGLGGDSVYFPGNERALRNLIRSCARATGSAGAIPGGSATAETGRAIPGGNATAGDVAFPETGAAIISELIPGDDVSVDAVRWDGFFYGAAYRVLEPRRKGVSLRRISIDAPEQVSTLRRILDAVDYHGVCGADFRISPDGTSYFLECNPRFCGGMESAIASGFNIPWVYWQLTHGITPDPVVFRPGIVTENI